MERPIGNPSVQSFFSLWAEIQLLEKMLERDIETLIYKLGGSKDQLDPSV